MGKKSPKLLNKQHSIICCLYAIIDSVISAPVKIIFPLLISVFFISCGDRPPVDKEYLESEQYQKFSEKQTQEQTLRIENYKTLEKYLVEFGQCGLGREQNYPLQIDNRILEQKFSACNEISDKYDTNFRIRNFGYSSFEDIIIRWIIVQKESIYEDTEFIAATYRDGSLVGFQTVGVFRQNLQQDISTNIKVDRQDDFIRIQSLMDRGIKYPFNYDNVIQSTFKIDPRGMIREKTEEATSYQSLPKYLEELNSCTMGKQWILPVQINRRLLDEHGITCETEIYHTNFTTRSVGYFKFNDLVIRLFDMKKNTYNRDHILMTAAYNESSLVSFQSVGTFRSFSPDFNTDVNISSNIKIYRNENVIYISSSIVRDQSFPIEQQNSSILEYEIETDGNIREL